MVVVSWVTSKGGMFRQGKSMVWWSHGKKTVNLASCVIWLWSGCSGWVSRAGSEKWVIIPGKAKSR